MTLDDLTGILGEKLGIPKSQATQAIHGLTEIVAEALRRGERINSSARIRRRDGCFQGLIKRGGGVAVFLPVAVEHRGVERVQASLQFLAA